MNTTIKYILLTNPMGWAALAVSDLMESWEYKVYERALSKNKATKASEKAFTDMVSDNGRIGMKQVLAIIGAYREVRRTQPNLLPDSKDFTTAMINTIPPLQSLDRMVVARVKALVPGYITAADGVIWEWLQGKKMGFDDKVDALKQSVGQQTTSALTETKERAKDAGKASIDFAASAVSSGLKKADETMPWYLKPQTLILIVAGAYLGPVILNQLRKR